MYDWHLSWIAVRCCWSAQLGKGCLNYVSLAVTLQDGQDMVIQRCFIFTTSKNLTAFSSSRTSGEYPFSHFSMAFAWSRYCLCRCTPLNEKSRQVWVNVVDYCQKFNPFSSLLVNGELIATPFLFRVKSCYFILCCVGMVLVSEWRNWC